MVPPALRWRVIARFLLNALRMISPVYWSNVVLKGRRWLIYPILRNGLLMLTLHLGEKKCSLLSSRGMEVSLSIRVVQ